MHPGYEQSLKTYPGLLGRIVTFHYVITGYQDRIFTFRWDLFNQSTRQPVEDNYWDMSASSEAAMTLGISEFTIEAVRDEANGEVWIPYPVHIIDGSKGQYLPGPFVARLAAYDDRGLAISAYAFSEPYN